VTQGVELMRLIGREFQIGKARFRGQYYCDPCLRPTRLSGKTEKFLEVFSDRGGLVAEILESGTIKKRRSHQPQGAAGGWLLLPKSRANNVICSRQESEAAIT
jgi:hypothetical protein